MSNAIEEIRKRTLLEKRVELLRADIELLASDGQATDKAEKELQQVMLKLRKIEVMLNLLTIEERTLIEDRYFNDKSIKEIKEIHKMSHSTLYRTFNTINMKLSALLNM